MVYERFPRLEERKTQMAGTLSGGEQPADSIYFPAISEKVYSAALYSPKYEKVATKAMDMGCFTLMEMLDRQKAEEYVLPRLLKEQKVDGMIILSLTALAIPVSSELCLHIIFYYT